MFSQKILLVVGILVLIIANIAVITLKGQAADSVQVHNRVAITLLGPAQDASSGLIKFVRDVWRHYFDLVNISRSYDVCQKQLDRAAGESIVNRELRLANARLRNLLEFKSRRSIPMVAAEVIGKDPSPWFKSAVIDKGKKHGIRRGMPVVVPAGIAGLISEVSVDYSRILLIIDPNSAVDAFVQRSRARGIIKGRTPDRFIFKYVLRKHDVRVGDIVVSSGLDGVFPRGLPVGTVSGILKQYTGIFQQVTVNPSVDFEKLEEVLVVLKEPDKINSERR